MKRQAIVIGLGQFGMAVAEALSRRSVEVLAIDSSSTLVANAASIATEAMCLDATDERSLAKALPARRDVSVCAIGEEHRDASIMCTALLRQLGSPRVVARANNDMHARILTMVGAHQVVNPERDFGVRLSNQLLYEDIKGELRLGEGVLITEAVAPPVFIGHTLARLQLPSRFGVTVVAVKRRSDGSVELPGPNTTVEQGDVLVMVSKDSAVADMLDRC